MFAIQAPSISSKSHGEEVDEGEMDPSKMMFDWGLGPESYNQEQVEGKFTFAVIPVHRIFSVTSNLLQL